MTNKFPAHTQEKMLLRMQIGIKRENQFILVFENI